MHFPPRQLNEIASSLLGNSGNSVHLWIDERRSETLAIIVAKPCVGLFATLAATLTSGPANIIAAQAYKLTDERVLDIFHLQGDEGSPFNIESDLERLETRISRVLDQDKADKRDIHKTFKVNILMQRVQIRVRELPKASYHETVIEVSAADQPRLLARLADTISSEGYSLHGASVSTFGERAVDVFFIEGKQSGPLSTDEITALCKKLARVAALPKK